MKSQAENHIMASYEVTKGQNRKVIASFYIEILFIEQYCNDSKKRVSYKG